MTAEPAFSERDEIALEKRFIRRVCAMLPSPGAMRQLNARNAELDVRLREIEGEEQARRTGARSRGSK